MDFETRFDSHSLKYNAIAERFGSTDKRILPMWVADMDISPPTKVIQPLRYYINETNYGYQASSTHSAVVDWHAKHGWQLAPEWIVPVHSVIGAMFTAVIQLTSPGDSVMIFTPVYSPFMEILRQSGREIIAIALEESHGCFNFRQEQLDKRAAMVLFCNPQNPTGTLWTAAQLKLLGDFCVDNDILILSDDVHSQFIFSGRTYIPIATLSDEIAAKTLTFQSPNKTYNLAHIPAACYVIAPAPDIRDQLASAISTTHQTPGGLAMFALQLAYQSDCQSWLSDVIKIITKHRQIMANALLGTSLLPVLEHATYFVWVNLNELLPARANAAQWLFNNTGIAANDGESFGSPGWVRINIACPTDMVIQASIELKSLMKAGT